MLAATQHGPPQGPMNLICMTLYCIVQDIMCWINACIDGHMDPGMDLPFLDQLVERSKQTWFIFIHVNSIYYTHLQSYTVDTMMSPPSALEQFNHIKGIQGPYQTWRIENMFLFFLLIYCICAKNLWCSSKTGYLCYIQQNPSAQLSKAEFPHPSVLPACLS